MEIEKCGLILKDLKVIEKKEEGKKFVFITLVDVESYDKLTFFADKNIKTDANMDDTVDCIFEITEMYHKPVISLKRMYKAG